MDEGGSNCAGATTPEPITLSGPICPAPTSLAPIEGYIIDKACALGAPQGSGKTTADGIFPYETPELHSLGCSMIPVCFNSGFVVLADPDRDGIHEIVYELTDAEVKQIQALLSEANNRVTEEDAGDNLRSWHITGLRVSVIPGESFILDCNMQGSMVGMELCETSIPCPVLFVDVRTADDFAVEHAPCTVNVPRPTLSEEGMPGVVTINNAVGFDKAAVIVVHCYTGGWAEQARGVSLKSRTNKKNG